MAQTKNLVKLTAALINATPIREIVELEPVKKNWINTYVRTTGLPASQAELIYEHEKVMFIKTVTASKELSACEPFSAYDCWMTLCISGLSLKEGLAYLVAFKKKMTVIIGWKGRLQQLFEMPDIRYIHEPQVVYDCDLFQMELGATPRVIQHIPEGRHKRIFEGEKKSVITYVYLVIDYANAGPRTFFMDRAKVLSIRDRYSQGWKKYLKDLPTITPDGKINMNGQNGPYQKDYDFPMWVTSEEEAFKKTIVRKMYNNAPNKLGRHKLFDEKLKERAGEEAENLMDFVDDQQGKQARPKGEELSYEELKTDFNEMGLEEEETSVPRETFNEDRVQACINLGLSDDPDNNGYTAHFNGKGARVTYEQLRDLDDPSFAKMMENLTAYVNQCKAEAAETPAADPTAAQEQPQTEPAANDTAAADPAAFANKYDTAAEVLALLPACDKSTIAKLYYFNSDTIDGDPELKAKFTERKAALYQ